MEGTVQENSHVPHTTLSNRTRGHPKWIRCKSSGVPLAGKNGRICPSVVLLLHRSAVPDLILHRKRQVRLLDLKKTIHQCGHDIVAIVGYPATLINHQEHFPAQELAAARISSVKRLILRHGQAIKDTPWVKEEFPNVREVNGEVNLVVTPLGTNKEVIVSPYQVLSVILDALRLDADEYLRHNYRTKNLKIPGEEPPCRHVVVGVPASFSRVQTQHIRRAAEIVFDTVDTITEPTAAAMAYGLTLSPCKTGIQTKSTALVLDMGGGTTDICLLELPSQRIIAIRGDARLGGNDMDIAILKVVQDKLGISIGNAGLDQCRRAKELLCGDVDHGFRQPQKHARIILSGQMYLLTQSDLNVALKQVVERTKTLIEQATKCSKRDVEEVILVGGATRAPMIRDLLRDMFPSISQICTSVNAMAAVSQGAAIQAAVKSGLVPLNEIKSAMMLDVTPYSIGVLTSDSHFCEVIPRDTPLPASGVATFELADAHQPGVSFQAVEQIEGGAFSLIGEYTFLLHRMNSFVGIRNVDISMKLMTTGEFVVSICDPNDPEHATHRNHYEDDTCTLPRHHYFADVLRDLISEQLKLLFLSGLLLCAYVVLKLFLFNPLETSQM